MPQTQNSAALRQRKPLRAAAIAGGQGALLLFLLQLTLHALDIAPCPSVSCGAQAALHLTVLAALAVRALGLTGLAGLSGGCLWRGHASLLTSLRACSLASRPGFAPCSLLCP